MSRSAYKNALRPMGDTEYMLEQWGRWRLNGMGVPRYVSPSFAIMRDNVEQMGGISYCITDELAVMVDGCVARLAHREKPHRRLGPTMSDCIWLYFGEKWPALRVARHLKISEAKTRELLKAGVAWIDSRLDALIDAA